MTTYIALILIFPLAGAVVNMLAGRVLPRRVSEWLACGVIWGAFVCSVAAFAGYREPVKTELASWLAAFDFHSPFSLYLDPLSLVMALMITFVCGLIHVYSVAYMAEDSDYVRYFALLNLFVFAMLLLVLAENLPLLYLGWEGVGFCSYALIGFWYHDEKNATAGRKAFIVTRIGDIAFAVAIVWMFRLFSTVSITELNGMGSLIPGEAATALGLLLLGGAMGKSAQMPLQVWLPDAMAGPTPVSAQIHAATMVTAGVYLLARMFPLISTSSTALAAIAVTGGLTAFYAATCALAQRDIKRVLAYSTISQIGYMMLGVGAGAITAATFHLLVHAFFKALLFLGAGCIIAAMHHEQDIFRMGGLRKSLPITFWPFLAGALCLAGIPLTGGFFSKDSILAAVWEKGGALYGTLYLLGMVTALVTSIYTFRIVYLVFGGQSAHAHGPPPEVPSRLLKKSGCSKTVRSLHPQKAPRRHSRPTPPKLPLWLRRPGATPHTAAFEDGGEMTVFQQPPRLMEFLLIPLALLGLGGGLLDLPAYLTEGWLSTFLADMPGTSPHKADPALEVALQAIAGAVALAGLAVSHFRYGGARRQARMEAATGQPSAVESFFLHGWRFDSLYRTLFIRPFEALASFLWQKVDEGVIDDSLDRLAETAGKAGKEIGEWTCGRVSVYLLCFAAGAALVLGCLTWMIF